MKDSTTGASTDTHATTIANAMTCAYAPHITNSLDLDDPKQVRALVHAAFLLLARDLCVAFMALGCEGCEDEARALIEECALRCERWGEVVEAMAPTSAAPSSS